MTSTPGRWGWSPATAAGWAADRPVGAVALGGLVAFLTLTVATLLQRGPFNYFGADFLAYYTAGELLRDGARAGLYEPQLQVAHQRAALAGVGLEFSAGGYPLFLNPPVLAALCVPFTALAVTPALAIWELLGLACAALAVVLLLRHSVASVRPLVVLVVLSFYPLLFGLFYGQVVGQVLLSLAVAYVAFKQRREGVAGLALGALLIVKPQLLPPLLLALLVCRRWRALLGFAGGGLVVAALSYWLVGFAGLAAYARQLEAVSRFDSRADSYLNTVSMVSWPALLAKLDPSLDAGLGRWLTLGLSLGCVAAVLAVWRGRWDPEGEQFDRLVGALLIAALLGAVHTYIHGAAVLLAPGISLAFDGRSQAVRWLTRLGFLLPTLVFLTFPSRLDLQATVLSLAMLAGLVLLLVGAPRGAPSRPTARPAT